MEKAAWIMDDSAAYLNDNTRSIFTYAAQLPYLRTAFRELEELYQANSVPVTNAQVQNLIIAVGVTDIGGPTGPALPNDFIEPIKLYERQQGSTYDFVEMTHREFLPTNQVPLNLLTFWSFEDQIIKLLEATSIMEVLLRYTAKSFGNIENENTQIRISNTRTFLGYRTAALCAEFIGENTERAQSLNIMAQLAVDRVLNITTKGRQNIATRRRPFLAGYKNRTIL